MAAGQSISPGVRIGVGKMKRKCLNGINKINNAIAKLDSLPLWWAGILLIAVILSPIFYLGEGCVFAVHDQFDETMMSCVLTARHLGSDFIPEILGGINASGLTPSSVLFMLLYCIMPPLYAFLCSYVIVLLCGFFGMYLAARELTDSSILSAVAAGVFVMLPFYPIYGLSVAGIPMILYAWLCLYKRKNLPGAFGITVLFGLTSHLVCTGYAVLGFWALALLFMLFRRNLNKLCLYGFLVLLAVYIVININMIAEILFGRALNGQAGYISHREEMVNSAMPFWDTVRAVFTESGQHAWSGHKGLILPIVLLLAGGALCCGRLSSKARKRYAAAAAGMAVLAAIAVFYGVCKLEPVAAWKNRITGFLHYFQMERFYWLYPAGWYLEFALAFSVWWTEGKQRDGIRSLRTLVCSLPVQCIVLGLAIAPTAHEVLYESFFYMNVNQKNNGSVITGYISWESYYAEELMENIERAIGRDMSSYRIAHLGISPAPALMHGFYTADGYSNNYPLEYKHEFRKVIRKELDKAPETAVYFDTWGSRCYLFNSQSGNYWMMKKGNSIRYEGLEFDMDALRSLGCEYILSGAEIGDPEDMGLQFMGYFETEKSYWGIWLYGLQEGM